MERGKWNGEERRKSGDLLVQLLAEVKSMREEQHADREKLEEIYDAWTRAKGAWWVTLRMTAVAMAIAAALAWVIDHWHKLFGGRS
jgi:hypothetical protein